MHRGEGQWRLAPRQWPRWPQMPQVSDHTDIPPLPPPLFLEFIRYKTAQCCDVVPERNRETCLSRYSHSHSHTYSWHARCVLPADRFRLNNLAPQPGARRKNKRKGRGHAAGQGASCGFGMRGQKSRSGSGVRPGFEGGQMPLYRRLPKLKGIAGGKDQIHAQEKERG